MAITVNGREYEWGDIFVALLGRVIHATAIDYAEKGNNSVIYARGNAPHSHQRGGKSFPLTLKMLQSEALAYENALFPRNVTSVPVTITLVYAPVEGGAITTRTFLSFLPNDKSFSHAANTPNAGCTVTGECLNVI